MKKRNILFLSCALFLGLANSAMSMESKKEVAEIKKKENFVDLLFKLFPEVEKDKLDACKEAVMDFGLYALLNSGDQIFVKDTLGKISKDLNDNIKAEDVVQASDKMEDILTIVFNLLEKEFDTFEEVLTKTIQKAKSKLEAEKKQASEEVEEVSESETIIKKQILKLLFRNISTFINEQDVFNAVIQSACKVLAQRLAKGPLRTKIIDLVASEIADKINSIGLADVKNALTRRGSSLKDSLKSYGIFLAIDNGQEKFFDELVKEIKDKTWKKTSWGVAMAVYKLVFNTLDSFKKKTKAEIAKSKSSSGKKTDFDKKHVFEAAATKKTFGAERVELLKDISGAQAQAITENFQESLKEVIIPELIRKRKVSKLEDIAANIWKKSLAYFEKKSEQK